MGVTISCRFAHVLSILTSKRVNLELSIGFLLSVSNGIRDRVVVYSVKRKRKLSPLPCRDVEEVLWRVVQYSSVT